MLTPENQAALFLRTIFNPGDCVLFRPIETWTDNGKKISKVDFKGIVYRNLGINNAGVWQHVDSLFPILLNPIMQRSATMRTNTFFGVCPRFNAKLFDMAWQMRTVRVLWSDVDHVTVEEARGRIKAAGLPEPSIIVNSGNGVHVYWILSEPYLIDDAGDPDPVYVEFIDQGEGKKKKPRKYRLDGKEKLYLDIPSNVPALSAKAQHVQDVIAGMAAKIGGDHTHDTSRLLRVPGTMNRKDERNGKTPIPCVLVECDPERRYSFDLFSSLAAASPDKTHRENLAKVSLPSSRKLSPKKRDDFNSFLLVCQTAAVGDRSEADFALCCFAIRSGMTKAEVSAAVVNVGKFGEGGERYFERTWAAAETEVRTEILTSVTGKSDAGDAAVPNSSSDGGEKKKSQATVLVDLALSCGAELWHSTTGDAYATIPVENHREHWTIRAKGFRRWLARQFYLKMEAAVGSEALQSAINTLEGQALFDGSEYPVAIRTAEHDGRVYLDLCDQAWRAVECSPAGWKIVPDPPVRFRRARAMLPLPEPVIGGHVDELRNYVNVHDDEWPLLLACLLAAYRPRGPYPVLNLHGEQGSAKSTTARALRDLCDPNAAPLRSEPKEPRDLMIAANNGWFVALDNLSHLPPWLSDALCRLSTGGGFSTRELYSDSDEVIFDAMRPVIVTGIEEVATRSDLLDRSVMVSLPTIHEHKRRPESEFWAAFAKVKPLIFGAMLTAVCEAVKAVSSTKIEMLPRMADFALWAVAGERSLGLEPEAFMRAYTDNRAAGNELAIESSFVGRVLMRYMKTVPVFTGSASVLLDELNKLVDDKQRKSKHWPKSPRGVSGVLTRLAPNLRQAGIEVTMERTARQRVITLVGTDTDSCVTTVTSVTEPGKQGFGNDANVTPMTQTAGPMTQNSPGNDASDDDDAKIPVSSNGVSEVKTWAA